MLVEQLVNNDFVQVLEVKVRKETALLLINEQIEVPIKKTTMRDNAARVKTLLANRKVPKAFKDIQAPAHSSQSYPFKFFILLLAYLKKTSYKRKQGYSPVTWNESEITQEMIQDIDLDLLLQSFRTKIKVVGKNLPVYFALESIKVSKSSLYNFSRLYPELPAMQWGKEYTPEEIDQWRQFLLNKPTRNLFTKQGQALL